MNTASARDQDITRMCNKIILQDKGKMGAGRHHALCIGTLAIITTWHGVVRGVRCCRSSLHLGLVVARRYSLFGDFSLNRSFYLLVMACKAQTLYAQQNYH